MLGLSSFVVAQLTAFPGCIGHQSWPDAPIPATPVQLDGQSI